MSTAPTDPSGAADAPDDKPAALPPIVAVGASAGGLEALEDFFSRTASDSGMAYVVIQHLSPDFESMMDQLLGRVSALDFQRAKDGTRVEANHVYLIPPGKELEIEGGVLKVYEKTRGDALTLPIDRFFGSLARDAGRQAIGVVLSGSGSDGARGVRELHEEGGLVLAQLPSSARFDGMPNAAIATGCVAQQLPPSEMAEVIASYVETGGVAAAISIDDSEVDDIVRALRDEYGIDFHLYKSGTFLRRIERRMALKQCPNVAAYLKLLQGSREELHALYKDLLIGVTRFFRDPDAFAQLARTAIPEIFARENQEEVRVWVAGCDTGEEAYTLAMLLAEHRQASGKRIPIKIFATDVHRGSLEIASAGEYPEASLSELPPRLRSSYFTAVDGGYRVSTALREMVVFAPHNLLHDAPFTKIDLVSCRNLLIYLNPSAQQRALEIFHFALRPQGALLLGASETTGSMAAEYEPLDKRWRIYRKARDVRLPLRLPSGMSSSRPPRTQRSPAPPPSLTEKRRRAADQVLFRSYAPPTILLGPDHSLQHCYNGAGKFLHLPDGEPASNALEMLPQQLRLIAGAALQKARDSKRPVLVRRVQGVEEGQMLRLRVQPVSVGELKEQCYLLGFENPDEDAASAAPSGDPEGTDSEIALSEMSRDRIIALEQELQHTRADLQTTLEEMEASNEELQATNEELVASNEELQAVNEELYTVNAEYQRKISELSQLNDDMDNLLASTEIGTLFLDQELRVRKFTPEIGRVFDLVPEDVGRPITAFSHNLDLPDLHGDLQAVCTTGEAVQREVRDRAGTWYLLRLRPYRKRGGDILGAVLSLIDISGLKQAEGDLRRMSTVFRDSADAILIENLEGRIVDLNPEAERLYGYSRDDLLGQPGQILVTESQRERYASLRRRCQQRDFVRNAEIEHLTRSGRPMSVLLTLSLLSDDDGEPTAMAVIAKDIDRRKNAEEEARLAVIRRDEFLAMLSHELRNPLAATLNAARVLKQHIGDRNAMDRAASVAESNAEHMARILDDLLDVARVIKGKIRLRSETLDLAEVLRSAVEGLGHAFEEHGHKLQVEMQAGAAWVRGDPARLRQVIENLLDNACKYSEDNGRIQVVLEREGEEHLLRVRDEGDGIAAEELATIFEPFAQANVELHRSEAGMGVGLTLVRSLIELHGGHIEAHSEGLGQGSEFRIRLPISDAPSQALDPDATPLAPAQAEHEGQEPPAEEKELGHRIVIVEDNAGNREVLKMLLEAEGFRVSAAPDGAAGLERIREERPDVALVDIGLPKLNGFEVAQGVREDDPDRAIYMIALSGYGRDEDIDQAKKAGFDEHVVKPPDIQRLLGLIRAAPKH